MSEGTAKKFMFVNRTAPYGTVYALESLEVVLITAAFDQDVSLVFVDDGVYQLKKGQQTKGIETKNFSPTYRALEGYDVEKLYVERESLAARGLTEDDLIVDVTVLAAARARQADGRAGRRPLLLTGTSTRCCTSSTSRRSSARRSTRACASPAPATHAADRGRACYAASRGTAVEARLTGGAGAASRSTRCCPTSRRAPSPTASSKA